jgi:hypothetical protein
MHPIRIRNVTAFDAVDLKFQLIKAGLVIEDDFTWKYFPSQWNNFTGVVGTRYVEFYFRDPMIATFYKLKWT